MAANVLPEKSLNAFSSDSRFNKTTLNMRRNYGMGKHFVLFVKCPNNHSVPIGSVTDFRKRVQPEEIIKAKRPIACNTCHIPVDVFKGELSVQQVSDTDSNDAVFQQACREWAI
jgi:hypothetical protein